MRPARDEIGGDVPADEWQTMATCPSDGRLVWAFGGHYKKPDIREADGEWWRICLRDRMKTSPTHWQEVRVPVPPRKERSP